MFCSCDAQKFLIVPVLDQKQILACGRVSGLETPANTFVTKKRNFPFLEAAQILVFSITQTVVQMAANRSLLTLFLRRPFLSLLFVISRFLIGISRALPGGAPDPYPSFAPDRRVGRSRAV